MAISPQATAFALIFLPILSYASDTKLIDEKEISLWGYSTLSFEIKSNSIATIKNQLIKSIKEAPKMKNHYFYYKLSQECFSNIYQAAKRKLNLIFLDEKDYRLSELSGLCVRIIETSANFSTFKEQPRVFTLFNNYLNSGPSPVDRF